MIKAVTRAYGLAKNLRNVKFGCIACRLVHGLVGRRSNGIKIYKETPQYLLINNLPEEIWPDTKTAIVGFWKAHTARPSEAARGLLEGALRDLARELGMKEGEYQIIESMTHIPDHFHLHLIQKKMGTHEREFRRKWKL
jgi:hypothetical protein